MNYFISGHEDLTREEFMNFYKNDIDKAIKSNKFNCFFIHDESKFDITIQNYLKKKSVDPNRITIFHKGLTSLHNPYNFKTRGNFTKSIVMDKIASNLSDADIAWIRADSMGSRVGGNILRRKPVKFSDLIKKKTFYCKKCAIHFEAMVKITNKYNRKPKCVRCASPTKAEPLKNKRKTKNKRDSFLYGSKSVK